MTSVVQFLVNSLSSGATYVLLGLGLTLVFGVMGLINFAYGTLIIACGYALAKLTGIGIPYVPALVLMVLIIVALSIGMERVAFRPFRGAPPTTLLLTSFGVALIMESLAVAFFGYSPVVVPTPAFLSRGFSVGGVFINWLEVADVVAVIAVLAVLHVILHRTRLGLNIRTTAEDAEVAQLLGVSSDRILLSTFAISGALTAVVGFLWLARTGTVTPTSDLSPTLIAFIVIVIGGLGTIRGAVIGGLVLGAFETAFSTYLPASITTYQSTFVFVVLTLVLIIRPEGIEGRKVELSK